MLTESEVLQKTPIGLFSYLDNMFQGQPWLSYHSATMAETFSHLEGTPVALDKILAVHAVGSDASPVCSEHYLFEKVCNVFNNCPMVVHASQPVFIEEVFFTVTQITEILEKVHETSFDFGKVQLFRGEIPAYVAAVARRSDLYMLPPRLSFAQDMLDHLEHRALSPEELQLVEALQGLEGSTDSITRSFLDSLLPDTIAADKIIARILGCFMFRPAEQMQKPA